MDTATLIKELPYKIPDEVILELKSSSDLSDKLKIIREWVHSNNNINHEKRLRWHQPLLKIAQKKKLLKNEAISLSNIVKIHDRLGQFEKSLTLIKRIQAIWLELCTNDKKYYHNLIISYCDEAVTLRLQNRLNLALDILYKGYEIIKKNGIDYEDTLIVLFCDLGVIYEKILDYPAALNYFNESLSLIRKSKDPSNHTENKILCYINIGNIHKASNKLNIACEKYVKAINIISKHNNYNQHYIVSNINLGETLVELEQYKKALSIYNNALEACEKSGSEMDLGFIYLLIAEVYINMNRMSEYDKFIKKGKKLVEKAGYPNDLIFLNHLLSRNYILKGDFDNGILLLLESVKICKKYNMDQHLLRAYKELSEVYKNKKDIENAFEYSKKYIEHRDIVDKDLHKLFLDQKQQSLNRMQEEINSVKEKEEKRTLELELQFKKRELLSKKLHSISNRDFLKNVSKSLKDIPKVDKKVTNIISRFQNQIVSSSTWSDYLDTYEQIDPKFINNLRKMSDKLGPTEIRVCSLIRLGLDNYEIANFMSISKRSVEQHRYRIKKRLGLNINLTEYIHSLS